MANSYTAIPSIVPGNLRVQGNLTVAGGQFILGALQRKYRIQEIANGQFSETVNLDATVPLQDDASSPSQKRTILPQNDFLRVESQPAGSPSSNTLLMQLFNNGLIVWTDELRVGSNPPYVRLAKNATGVGQFSVNLAKDLATRDDGAKQAFALVHDEVAPHLYTKLYNAAGLLQSGALNITVWADGTSVTVTGVTGLQTVKSTTLRGGLLGTNGMVRIVVNGSLATGVGGSESVQLQYGGQSMCTFNVGASQNGPFVIHALLAGANSALGQLGVGHMAQFPNTSITGGANPALNSANDQTLALLTTPGLAADSLNCNAIVAVLVNNQTAL